MLVVVERQSPGPPGAPDHQECTHPPSQWLPIPQTKYMPEPGLAELGTG